MHARYRRGLSPKLSFVEFLLSFLQIEEPQLVRVKI